MPQTGALTAELENTQNQGLSDRSLPLCLSNIFDPLCFLKYTENLCSFLIYLKIKSTWKNTITFDPFTEISLTKEG